MQRILNAENAFSSSSLPSPFAKKKKRVSEIRKLPENINTLCTKLSFSKTEKFEKKNVTLTHEGYTSSSMQYVHSYCIELS